MNNLEKHFVNYQQAMYLKSIGFDEPCFGWYEHNGNFYYCYQEGLVPPSPSKKLIKGCCLAPLKSQVFEWFREKYELHSTITSISQESWQWHIQKPGQQLGKLYNEDFYTYEEAESACIDKLIELLQHDK